MKEKKSFLLLYEFETVFAELESDEERSRLIMAIFAYMQRGEEPEFTGTLRYAWRTHIKPKMDEMAANYEKKCNSLRDNARKRWSMQNNANVSSDMQMDANADYKEKKKEKKKKYISNNDYSKSNIQQPVDKSVDNVVDNSNAQQGPDDSAVKSLDGEDFYKLSERDAFEVFRNTYPRRQGRLTDVQTAWVTATVGSHILPGDLVMAAKRYAAECKEKGTEQQFIKMPQNFISSGVWKQYAPKFLPTCAHCHGQGVYEDEGNMVMCNCDRRYG